MQLYFTHILVELYQAKMVCQGEAGQIHYHSAAGSVLHPCHEDARFLSEYPSHFFQDYQVGGPYGTSYVDESEDLAPLETQ